MDYYDRYKNGQCIEVWSELTEMQTYSVEQQKQIVNILQLMFDRVEYNLSAIVSLLPVFGYTFHDFGIPSYHEATPYEIVQNSGTREVMELNNLLKPYGKLPVVVQSFYRRIKSIDLRGSFTSWQEAPLLDALYIEPVKHLILLNNLSEGGLNQDEDNNYYMLFSLDECMKEGVSGDAYAIYLDKEIKLDNYLLNYPLECTFVEYLRDCFKWGGLPGLANIQEKDIPSDILTGIYSISERLLPI
ncbi:hypothetical protein QNI19_23080 [Cytophagaceae bacterium DM2B3-1]|uniref:SMI1/KNR4 family protein n=1 Tax=Xanthocytophaga flava TaxID=3048013 RepID=A0ABT7CQ16_9BACT|nr:hypothetical protein [Xanthocytophaga flavus]MDJ1495838.1 hypothetical protein [Xanthocytophaga flavus]